MKGRRLLAFGLIISGAVGLTALTDRYGALTGVHAMESRALEMRQRSAAFENLRSEDDATDVVLVLFDSATVREWPYLSPFPRPFLAQLVDAFSSAGAKTIGLDVYLEDLAPELNALNRGDDLLHDAIERAGNVILVAPIEQTESGPYLKLPDPYFADVAAGVGSSDFPTPFETIQDGLLVVHSEGGIEPSFALALYVHFKDLDLDLLMATVETRGWIDLPGIPETLGQVSQEWLESRGRGGAFAHPFPLRFSGPPSFAGAEDGTFRSFPASYAITAAEFFPELFKDQIVLLGTGFHDSDKFRTPFYDQVRVGEFGGTIYGWMYGVEIHANSVQNFLVEEYIVPIGRGTAGLYLLLLAAIPGLAVMWRGAIWGGITAGLMSLFALANGFWTFAGEIFTPVGTILTFDERFVLFPMVTPLLAVLFSYLGSVAYVAIIEGREKRFIRGAFGKYVSPAVVAEIANSPETLKLGGQKRPLTILFSDLAGFTTLSEGMSPEDLISLLNEYLTEMTGLVMKEGGTLDKYIGDAIMAFWNAPQSQGDHADRALRCAIRMQRHMVGLNAQWREKGRSHEPFVVRVGINTGAVVVGNVGGKDRFDYSAIGDGVNLAARLEPANKTYGTLVMVSEHTLAQAVPAHYRLRDLDLIAVKGKVAPVRVFELLGFADEVFSESKEEALRFYDKGLGAYQQRDWELAAGYFDAGLEADPLDGPCRVYLRRCREFLDSPPAEDWDFVVRRTAK